MCTHARRVDVVTAAAAFNLLPLKISISFLLFVVVIFFSSSSSSALPLLMLPPSCTVVHVGRHRWRGGGTQVARSPVRQFLYYYYYYYTYNIQHPEQCSERATDSATIVSLKGTDTAAADNDSHPTAAATNSSPPHATPPNDTRAPLRCGNRRPTTRRRDATSTDRGRSWYLFTLFPPLVTESSRSVRAPRKCVVSQCVYRSFTATVRRRRILSAVSSLHRSWISISSIGTPSSFGPDNNHNDLTTCARVPFFFLRLYTSAPLWRPIRGFSDVRRRNT